MKRQNGKSRTDGQVNHADHHVQGRIRHPGCYETIKAYRIAPESFSEKTGELTPSLKFKKVIMKKYRDLIESMYPPAG